MKINTSKIIIATLTTSAGLKVGRCFGISTPVTKTVEYICDASLTVVSLFTLATGITEIPTEK